MGKSDEGGRDGDELMKEVQLLFACSKGEEGTLGVEVGLGKRGRHV